MQHLRHGRVAGTVILIIIPLLTAAKIAFIFEPLLSCWRIALLLIYARLISLLLISALLVALLLIAALLVAAALLIAALLLLVAAILIPLLVSALLTAAYLLPVSVNAFFPGRAQNEAPELGGGCEVKAGMAVPLVILAALTVVMGLWPNLLTQAAAAIAADLL